MNHGRGWEEPFSLHSHRLLQGAPSVKLTDLFVMWTVIMQDGLTPLFAAALGGYTDIAALLLDRGAKVDAVGKVVGCCSRPEVLQISHQQF